MSNSYACEYDLKELAKELHRKANELEEVAEALRVLRSEEKIAQTRAWAKQWLSRELGE